MGISLWWVAGLSACQPATFLVPRRRPARQAFAGREPGARVRAVEGAYAPWSAARMRGPVSGVTGL